MRAIIGSNPTVSHQLELELELSVGLRLGFDKIRLFLMKEKVVPTKILLWL